MNPPGPTRIVLRDPAADRWLHFDDPVDVLATQEPARAPDTLAELERRVRRERLFAAGFVTYEAAPGFDAAYRTRPAASLPPVCFGLFGPPRLTRSRPGETPRIDTRMPRTGAGAPGTGARTLPTDTGMLPADASAPRTETGTLPTGTGAPRTGAGAPRAGAESPPTAAVWRMAATRQDYFGKIAAIQERIRAGDTYQINYTTRQVAEGIFDPLALFDRMVADAPYAAWIEIGDYAVASASPELFFRLEGDRIRCQPMKGTVRRGMTLAQDRELAAWLRRSGKNRAENVMIADMVRNDLGRIATPGSVAVRELFAVQRYSTVWQMISTVQARADAAVADIFRALFPCASVTGAPKVASMRLIESLEREPREIYTGAIGYLAPDRRAQFSVAIRTAVVNRRTGAAFYGVGSGIVADSEPEAEFAECHAKAKILARAPHHADFALLETMLWTSDKGIFLLDYHLRRIADSAHYFGFEFDAAAARRALESLLPTLHGPRRRIRLLQYRSGAPKLEHDAIGDATVSTPVTIRLARRPIQTEDPFLYHKTTRRQAYEQALAAVAGCDDVLLWNPEGYLTETSIANIVVEIGGRRVTPPVACGLLGGTYRQWLLDRGEIRERKVHIDELPQIRQLAVINSVRGERPARLLEAGRADAARAAAAHVTGRRELVATSG